MASVVLARSCEPQANEAQCGIGPCELNSNYNYNAEILSKGNSHPTSRLPCSCGARVSACLPRYRTPPPLAHRPTFTHSPHSPKTPHRESRRKMGEAHTKHDPPCLFKYPDRPYPPGPAQTDILKGQNQRQKAAWFINHQKAAFTLGSWTPVALSTGLPGQHLLFTENYAQAALSLFFSRSPVGIVFFKGPVQASCFFRFPRGNSPFCASHLK